MTVKLAEFIPDQTKVVEIRSGDRPTGWTITICGPSHPKAIAWTNAKGKRDLQRAEQLDAQRLNGRKIKPEGSDLEEKRRENVGFVVSRIVDWSPVDLGAGPVSFSDTAATDLLADPQYGFVLGQLLEELEREGDFIRGSAKG